MKRTTTRRKVVSPSSAAEPWSASRVEEVERVLGEVVVVVGVDQVVLGERGVGQGKQQLAVVLRARGGSRASANR